MNTRVFLSSIFAFAFAMSAWQPASAMGPSAPPPPNVTVRAWSAAQAGAADVIVYGAGYPDLSPARALITKEEKTKFVFDALTAHAEKSLAAARATLAKHGTTYETLWIVNALAVKNADAETLAELASLAEVRQIDLDAKFKGAEGQTSNPAWKAYGKSFSFSPQTVEWGVQRVNAPQVWLMGYRGAGVVVAGLDTGIYWQHPALLTKYRGWDGAGATHAYNWFDPVAHSAVPLDDNSHGTHTIGTAVGNDGATRQIGVAPDAKWIGCRNMDHGTGSVSLYTQCFQFAMAPNDLEGNNPNPALSADITNNSWGCDPSYGEVGCDDPSALITITQALRDAGVMVVSSAGNTKPYCSGISTAPATLDQSFAAGALNSGNFIASFSNLGPSSLTGHIKPNISAPGESILSAAPGGGYGIKSGTSMASPHVAGTAALLMSAAPGLRGQVDEVEALLAATASPLVANVTCGGVSGYIIPNNVFGYGLVNAQAAVSEALKSVITATTTLSGALPAPVKILYELTASNTSGITLTNVQVNAALPAGLSFDGTSDNGTFDGSHIIWVLGDLPPRSSLKVTFWATASRPGTFTLSDYRVGFGGMVAPSAGRGRAVPATVPGWRLFLPNVMK